MPVKIASVDDVNPHHQTALRGFGKRVLSLRRARQMSQAQLAALIGAGRGSCALWETGGSIPDLPTICRLAECLDVTATWLALGVGPTPAIALALEERCVEVPVVGRDVEEQPPLITDARLAAAFGIAAPHAQAIMVPGMRGGGKFEIDEILIVDSSVSYFDRGGSHAFEGASGAIRTLNVVLTGAGPMSATMGALFPIEADLAGVHRGIVILRMAAPKI